MAEERQAWKMAARKRTGAKREQRMSLRYRHGGCHAFPWRSLIISAASRLDRACRCVISRWISASSSISVPRKGEMVNNVAACGVMMGSLA